MASVSIFFVLGIVVAILLCVVLMKFINTDRKVNSQYDERQETVRNRGYKYGFYSMVIVEVVYMALGIGGVSLPIADYLLHFFAILFGCLVLCIYSIWNDAYWGLNNDRKKYIIFFAVVTLLNVPPIIAALREGDLSTKGTDALPIVNIMVVIWLVLIAIVAIVKKVVDSKAGEED